MTLRQILKLTPLHALCHAWRALACRQRSVRSLLQWTDDDQKRADFYRQFVRPDDLVFDVGANMGNRAKVFLYLGARVLAVEPQPLCVGVLRHLARRDPRLTLLQKAVGRETGTSIMYVSDAHTLSTLSHEWIERTTASGRFASVRWQRRETVETATLDQLIGAHGVPAFVKIDVEGYEHEVLAGLSAVIPCVSFEFAAENSESTLYCVDRLASFGSYEFQVSPGESMVFCLRQWVSADEIRGLIRGAAIGPDGDVYARIACA